MLILILLMYVKNILIITLKAIVFSTLLTCLAACESFLPEPHKIDIEQGNAITEEEFQSLYTGMSETEVIEALGSPLIRDPFHPDQWVYLYRLKPGKGRLRESKFTLYFRDGILVKIDGDEYKEY